MQLERPTHQSLVTHMICKDVGSSSLVCIPLSAALSPPLLFTFCLCLLQPPLANRSRKQSSSESHLCHCKFSCSHIFGKEEEKNGRNQFNNIFNITYPKYYHFNVQSIGQIAKERCYINTQSWCVFTLTAHASVLFICHPKSCQNAQCRHSELN